MPEVRPEEIRRIAAIPDPVVRNLQITECYYRLSQAMTARTGMCSNWCTYATWASKQAGCTIRGEDMIEAITRNTITGSVLSHPIRAFWKRLLRRGLLYPDTRLGRLVKAIHTPFDAVERASDAVARGNLKVFDEIGYQFARFVNNESLDLKPGPPPEGQDYLRVAFQLYSTRPQDPQAVYHANLLIGLHEQTRLQPEIQESLESIPETAENLAFLLKPVARAISRHARALTREILTDMLMSLSVPSTTLQLGRNIDRQPSPMLASLTDSELVAFLSRIRVGEGCAAIDWADLDQRMRYIAVLFRCFHDCSDLLLQPFDDGQTRALRMGQLPSGQL